MTATAVPHRCADLAEVSSEARTVVLNLDRPSDPPVILLGAAHEVWALVDGSRSLEEIENHFAGAATPSDVHAVVKGLVDAGLLASGGLP